MADERQREYQRKYDKKTKMISVKYILSDMREYDRLKEYLEKTGQSANSFIKSLINDFFEQKKYVLNIDHINTKKNKNYIPKKKTNSKHNIN